MDWLIDFITLARDMIALHPVEVILLAIAAVIIWKTLTSEYDKKFIYMMSVTAIVCILSAVFFYGGDKIFSSGISAEEAEQLTRQISEMTENYKNSTEAMERFFYYGGNLTEYYAEVEKFLRFKSGQGFTEAQFYLGYMLDPKHTKIKRNYPPIQQDLQEAKNFYTMAAEKDHMMAQFYLGNVLFDEKDYPNAAKYYKLAADKGYSGAQGALGYMAGLGYVYDSIEAAAYGKDFQEGYSQGLADR